MIKILILIVLIIVASIIASIALIKAENRKTILWIGYAIGMISTMIIIGMNDIPYIQNLEEKLNIYRETYEEFCLEDSKKQSDAYESI